MPEAQEVHAAPHAAQDAAPEPKRRGRPPGSKNKPKQNVPTDRLQAADAPVVPQDVPQLHLQPLLLKRYRELEEARAFNNWRRAQAGAEGAAAPGRREPADRRRPCTARYPSCATRGPSRGVNGRRTKLRNGKEMKTLRAHGFNQRPRFEQVVGYLERNEPLPWTSRTASHLVHHKPLLPGRFCTVQQGPQPLAPAAHASAGNFRKHLPHSRVRRNPLC